jgi:uncharacterized phage-associated protein
MGDQVNVFDVAQHILDKKGVMTTWKLQKLVYYSQAWSLVWDDAPLFSERIEAWANGPVVPRLYQEHKGNFTIGSLKRLGDPAKLDADQRETIDIVLREYGDKTSQWLSDLTHREEPWLRARKREGLAPGQRGEAVITKDDMAEYYGGLTSAEES